MPSEGVASSKVCIGRLANVLQFYSTIINRVLLKMPGKTLYDKLWDSHVVREEDDGTSLIYIDRHLIHEVTSPQAFAGLKEAGRSPRRVGANLAVADHNVPTKGRAQGIENEESRIQIELLEKNAKEFGLPFIDFLDVH